MLAAEKAIRLGHPSYVWRRGQDRRLNQIRQHVPLDSRTILDVGCGLGMYVTRFRDFSESVYGVDLDREKVAEASRTLPNIFEGPAERLPFNDQMFDLVFLNEVLEHVDDDRQTIRESFRVLRPGGHIVVYAPNRLYPFETHGFYLFGRYFFRLIPIVNWLPDRIRDVFCPHVRVYTASGLKSLFDGLPVVLEAASYIYPGLDNIAERHQTIGPWLQAAVEIVERTPLRCFGISHFIVARKLHD